MRPLLHLAQSSGYTAGMSTVKDWGGAMSGFGVTETVLVLIWALLLIVPIVLAFVVSYFLIKAAVKNGVKEAVRDLDMERAAHREQ